MNYNNIPIYITPNIQIVSSANNGPVGSVLRQETIDGNVVYYTWTDNKTYSEYVIYYPETNPYALLQESLLKDNPELEEKQSDKKVEQLELFNGEPKRKIRI